jgi:DNA-binding MarR family transcriptional regulator
MAHLLAKVAGDASGPSKPVTYVYSELGLSKAKGTKIKKMLLEAGLASEQRTTASGRTEVRLRLTDKGKQWLGEQQDLLERPLARWDTKRFGGEKSRELERVFDEYARKVLGAREIVPEADDLSGGKHDALVTLPDASELAVEFISGESKATELRHLLAAQNMGRKYLGLCWDEGIRQRVRHYIAAAGMAEGPRVQLLTKQELQDLQTARTKQA